MKETILGKQGNNTRERGKEWEGNRERMRGKQGKNERETGKEREGNRERIRETRKWWEGNKVF